MAFNPATLELKAKNKQVSKDLLSNLSIDFLSSLLEKKYPDHTGEVAPASKLKLSQEFLKYSQVQRILSDLGGRLEEFLNQQLTLNLDNIENFLQEPDLETFAKKIISSGEKSAKRALSQRPNTVQPLYSDNRFTRTSQADSPTTNKMNSTMYNPSTKRGSPSRSNTVKSKNSSPLRLGRRETTPGEQQRTQDELDDIRENNHRMYCYSDLGQTFIKAIGKTEQIRDNLSNLVSEMEDHVTVGFSKTKTNNKDMEELLATKERVVNILEEIIEKEYTTPQDMAEMIQDNWDITEEYERQIADINKEFQKEKDMLKQRYENRIFYLKENFVAEIAQFENEIKELKNTLTTKEEEFASQLTAKNNQIELLMQRIAGLEAPSDRDEDTVKSRVIASRSEKRSKTSAQKSNYNNNIEKKSEKGVELKSVVSNVIKMSKLTSNSKGKTSKNQPSKAPSGNRGTLRSSRIADEAVMNNDSIMTQDNLEVTSIYDERRGSRTSVSSRGVSTQQFMIPSGKNIDDWDGDEKQRKNRKLREFFVRLYERVLIRKGITSLNSYNSLEGSDDEGGSEDWNLDIYDQLARQMADPELCEAAGVKPIDVESLSIRDTSSNKKGNSLRMKIPGLLFQRRKKTAFNFVEIIPEIKEEVKDERGTSMLLNEREDSPGRALKGKLFESSKENLINFIEAVTNQNLPATVKELAIPKLLEEEVTLSLDKVLTLGDFQEYLRVSDIVVVTVEQLIINVLNFYVALLSEKGDILRFYMIGKRVSEKKYSTVQTDTVDLPIEKEKKNKEMLIAETVKMDQETQTTNPNLYLDLRSTDTPSQFSMPKSNNQSPMKVLQESLDSWKNRLSHSHSRKNEVLQSSEAMSPNLAQDLKNLLTKKRGTVLGLSNKMVENRFRRKLLPTKSINEKDKELSPTGASPYLNKFLYAYDNSNPDLQEGKLLWTNVVAEEGAPSSGMLTSERLLEGGTPQYQRSATMKANQQSIPVTFLQIPQKEKTVVKRDEVRKRINLEKRRFTAYKEEEERIVSRPAAAQRAMEQTSYYYRPETRWATHQGTENQNEIHELCKRTVLALYDYIGNVQKEMINPTKLKIDLKDVNRKVAEIEEMLLSTQADQKYVALAQHFQKRGSTPATGRYGSRMAGTGDSWRLNPMNETATGKSAFAGKRRETDKSAEKKTKIEEALLDPDQMIGGFSRDEQDGSPKFNLDASLEFRGQSVYGSHVKTDDKQGLKNIAELDGVDSLANSGSLDDEETLKIKNISKKSYSSEKKAKPKTKEAHRTREFNSAEKTGTEGSASRMEILSKLGPSELAGLPPKCKNDKASKERDYRFLKKASFQVRKVDVSRDRVSNALNNSII